jgi:hypothetical protein
MPVTINLTPAAIAVADYPTAQTPALGGEMEVYLSAKPSYLLGTAQLTADGVLQYKYVGVPSSNTTPGPIVMTAIGGGVIQNAAETVTYAGLSGTFSPVVWSSNQTYTFPVGRAVELTGTYAHPTSSSAPTLGHAAVSTHMLRGSQFAIIELPTWSDFKLAGCTTERRVKVPARGTKNIACGMNEAEWTTSGMTRVGELEISGLNQGYDDGLLRFAGVKCQVALVRLRESRLITERFFCLDWTGECETPFPSGDSEATVSLRGQFSRAVVLPAPGAA